MVRIVKGGEAEGKNSGRQVQRTSREKAIHV